MPGDPALPGGPGRRGPSGRARAPPVIWDDAAPAPGRRAAQHRRRRPVGQRGAGARARWRPPRRRGRTSASCPSWPSRATRPRTSSSSRASWPTTWPRSRRSPRPPGSARWWSASSAPHRAGSGWPTPPRCAPAGVWSGVYRKRFLPNYGVFDEQRWFVPSDEPPPLFGVAGAWVGVSICEDVWFDDGPVAQAGPGRRRRRREPQRVALQPGPAGRAPRHAVAAGWPRPAAPSPT